MELTGPKHHFTYDEIHRTVSKLATTIRESGYEPDVLVAIGSGGYIPARMLKTYVRKVIFTVGISFYTDENTTLQEPRKVQWIDEVEKKLKGRHVLLVDEVDDTRSTLEYCIKELLSHGPASLAVAVLHNKLKPKKGTIPEEVAAYFAGENLPDEWFVYPWDALDIDAHNHAAHAQG